MGKSVCVGMGEMVMTADQSAELMCLGLGSCIAVCAYEPKRRMGVMIHIVLPASNERIQGPPSKYADTAIPLLVQELKQAGILVRNLRVVLCGGAAIFPTLVGVMDIGQRNLTAVRDKLRASGFQVVKEEVGGKESRTVSLNVSTGEVRMRTVRTGENVLVNLGEL